MVVYIYAADWPEYNQRMEIIKANFAFLLDGGDDEMNSWQLI